MSKAWKHIVGLAFLILFNSVWVQGQPAPGHRYRKYNQSVLNWGLKLGLNATAVTSFSGMRGEEQLQKTSYHNQSGCSLTAFFRINLDRFLIQPEIGWSVQNKDLFFTFPSENAHPPLTELSIKAHTIDINALIGYNITRTGPFIFNVITGTSIRYKLNTQFLISPDNRFQDRRGSYNMYGVLGFSTNISAVHFDIRYEISTIDTDLFLDEVEGRPDLLQGVLLRKNENILSFSCGFMF